MKLLSLSILFFIAAHVTGQSNIANGRYELNQKGDIYTYIFSNDSNLLIIHKTDTTFARFSIDTTANPKHINMKFYDKYDTLLYVSVGIYEHFGRKNIRLKMSANLRDRPNSFFPKGSLDIVHLV